MRAAARFREGKALAQTVLQPTADALLAERLLSSALAGPSSASNLAHLAQRTTADTNLNSLGKLARYFSTGAGRSTGIRNAGPCVPTQACQCCTPLFQSDYILAWGNILS